MYDEELFDDEPLYNDILDIIHSKEEPPDWLVPDILLQGNMVILAGNPSAGKSYVSYTLAMAVATGVPAMSGLIVAPEPKKVLYFDEENSRQDRIKYIKRSNHGILAANLHLPHLDPDLLEKNLWTKSFELGGDDWYEVAEYYVKRVQPHLVVFDTANSAFAIENENDNSEASRVIKKIRALMNMTQPTMTSLILKHAKISTEKGGRRTIRGAKTWWSECDSLVYQVKTQGRPRNDGLHLTRLEPDKTRAYGLTKTIFITPSYTDGARTGLRLDGSYEPDKEHKRKLAKEEEEEEG